jgi:hypothetical protein
VINNATGQHIDYIVIVCCGVLWIIYFIHHFKYDGHALLSIFQFSANFSKKLFDHGNTVTTKAW